MAVLRLAVETNDAEMDEVRPVLESALEKLAGKSALADALTTRWDGDVLRLSGPGAKGKVFCEDGQLCARVKLKLPAVLARSKIERELGTALEKVAARVKSADPEAEAAEASDPDDASDTVESSEPDDASDTGERSD